MTSVCFCREKINNPKRPVYGETGDGSWKLGVGSWDPGIARKSDERGMGWMMPRWGNHQSKTQCAYEHSDRFDTITPVSPSPCPCPCTLTAAAGQFDEQVAPQRVFSNSSPNRYSFTPPSECLQARKGGFSFFWCLCFSIWKRLRKNE